MMFSMHCRFIVVLDFSLVCISSIYAFIYLLSLSLVSVVSLLFVCFCLLSILHG